MNCETCGTNKNKNLSSYFTEYSETTSIHGIKFLGEKKRGNLEKIFWMVVIGLSLYFCINLCYQSYKTWRNSPVLVSFATSETPIWKIPFPAVTICPRIRAHKGKYDVAEKMQMINNSFGSDENLKLNYFSSLCPNLDYIKGFKPFGMIEDTMIDFLIDIAPNVSSLFLSCQLFGKKCDDIDSMFVPLVTSGGICYTFNMMDRLDMFTNHSVLDYYKRLGVKHQTPSNWTIEENYSDKTPLKTYPHRTFRNGNSGGLEVVLRSFYEDADVYCGEISGGFKIILHHPAEIPRFNERYFWVPLNQLVTVAVKPNMMTTSKSLLTYNPKVRKCYFAKEKRLEFFKVYNQQNCLLECLTKHTYETCGCVKFHMPRNESMPICGPKKRKCTVDASNNFLTKDIIAAKGIIDEEEHGKSLKSKIAKLITKKRKSHNISCNCLPSCFSLNFDTETSQLDWLRIGISAEELADVYHDQERNELYGKTQLLANCGGLLGLFTGFSIISLVEIIYFLTLRLICNVRSHGFRNWSGSDELKEVTVK